MARTVEAWCCGIAADDEIGETKIEIYASKEDCMEDRKCAAAEPEYCAPRRLTITVHDREPDV